MCRSPTKVSTLGDYYWTLGNHLLALGELDPALDAFNRAAGQYQAEGAKAPPAALLCDQGQALAMGREDPDRAEQAAQVLHRCLLAVPPSSSLRTAALKGLAVLSDAGLDEMKLAPKQAATKYMTGDAVKKSVGIDLVELAVTSDENYASKKSFASWMELMQAPAALEALKPCWQAHNDATNEDKLSVTLELKSKYIQGEFADQDRYALTIGAAPGGAGAACVHAAVTAMAGEYRGGSGSWKANFTYQLAPRQQ